MRKLSLCHSTYAYISAMNAARRYFGRSHEELRPGALAIDPRAGLAISVLTGHLRKGREAIASRQIHRLLGNQPSGCDSDLI